MKRSDLTEKLLDIKREKEWTWKSICEQIGGYSEVLIVGAILGQMTTGFPLSPLTASTFILVGLSGVNLGDHQRFIFPWAFGTTLVMTAVALATGVLLG